MSINLCVPDRQNERTVVQTNDLHNDVRIPSKTIYCAVRALHCGLNPITFIRTLTTFVRSYTTEISHSFSGHRPNEKKCRTRIVFQPLVRFRTIYNDTEQSIRSRRFRVKSMLKSRIYRFRGLNVIERVNGS